MLNVKDLGEMSVAHSTYFDWTQVPVGFDWVIISALRIVAANIYPLKEDEEFEGMLRPIDQEDLEADGLRVIHLESTKLGELVDYLIDQDLLPPGMSNALPTPLVVLTRPADKPADAVFVESDGRVDGFGFS